MPFAIPLAVLRTAFTSTSSGHGPVSTSSKVDGANASAKISERPRRMHVRWDAVMDWGQASSGASVFVVHVERGVERSQDLLKSRASSVV
jgi:hypothetical protein